MPRQPLKWFTDAESWAWEQVCMDRAAYMQSVDEDDPRKDCYVDPAFVSPHGNQLSSRFIQVINTQEPFVSHIPSGWAFFLCAEFPHRVEVGKLIPHSLNLYGAHFMDGANFNAQIKGQLVLFSAIFKEDLDLANAEIELVNLDGATIGGNLGSVDKLDSQIS